MGYHMLEQLHRHSYSGTCKSRKAWCMYMQCKILVAKRSVTYYAKSTWFFSKDFQMSFLPLQYCTAEPVGHWPFSNQFSLLDEQMGKLLIVYWNVPAIKERLANFKFLFQGLVLYGRYPQHWNKNIWFQTRHCYILYSAKFDGVKVWQITSKSIKAFPTTFFA